METIQFLDIYFFKTYYNGIIDTYSGSYISGHRPFSAYETSIRHKLMRHTKYLTNSQN